MIFTSRDFSNLRHLTTDINGEIDPQFIQKITSSTTKGKTSRSRSFQFSATSGSPSNRRGRLQKAETISEDRLESARQASLDEKIAPVLETRMNLLKDDNTSQPSSDDEKAPPPPVPPAPTIQVQFAWRLQLYIIPVSSNFSSSVSYHRLIVMHYLCSSIFSLSHLMCRKI